jgi:hypothetical protein
MICAITQPTNTATANPIKVSIIFLTLLLLVLLRLYTRLLQETKITYYFIPLGHIIHITYAVQTIIRNVPISTIHTRIGYNPFELDLMLLVL